MRPFSHLSRRCRHVVSSQYTRAVYFPLLSFSNALPPPAFLLIAFIFSVHLKKERLSAGGGGDPEGNIEFSCVGSWTSSVFNSPFLTVFLTMFLTACALRSQKHNLRAPIWFPTLGCALHSHSPWGLDFIQQHCELKFTNHLTQVEFIMPCIRLGLWQLRRLQFELLPYWYQVLISARVWTLSLSSCIVWHLASTCGTIWWFLIWGGWSLGGTLDCAQGLLWALNMYHSW